LLCQSCHTNVLQDPKRALRVTQREDAEDASAAISKYIRRKEWEKRIVRLSANKVLFPVLSHALASSLLGGAWCSCMAEGWGTLA